MLTIPKPDGSGCGLKAWTVIATEPSAAAAANESTADFRTRAVDLSCEVIEYQV